MGKVRSALGQVVDFDLMQLMNDLSTPKSNKKPYTPPAAAPIDDIQVIEEIPASTYYQPNFINDALPLADRIDTPIAQPLQVAEPLNSAPPVTKSKKG